MTGRGPGGDRKAAETALWGRWQSGSVGALMALAVGPAFCVIFDQGGVHSPLHSRMRRVCK